MPENGHFSQYHEQNREKHKDTMNDYQDCYACPAIAKATTQDSNFFLRTFPSINSHLRRSESRLLNGMSCNKMFGSHKIE